MQAGTSEFYEETIEKVISIENESTPTISCTRRNGNNFRLPGGRHNYMEYRNREDGYDNHNYIQIFNTEIIEQDQEIETVIEGQRPEHSPKTEIQLI